MMPLFSAQKPSPFLVFRFGPVAVTSGSLAFQARYACLLLGLAVLASALCNPLLARIGSGPEFAFALLLSSLGLVLGVYLLHCLGRIGLVLAPVFGLVLSLFTYITALYYLEPGPSFIGAMAETTPEEAGVYITFASVGTILAGVAAYTAVVWQTRRYFSHLNVFILGFFTIHLLFAQTNSYTRHATKEMRHAAKWSMEYLTDPIKYALQYVNGEKGRVDALRSLPSAAAFPASLRPQEPLTIVLVVGESLRADHLGMNGYARNTTPHLAKETLVNFPRTRSAAAWTRESVIGMFTNRLPEQEQSTHGSFVSIFQKLGFTVATYSANTKPNRSDYSFAILTEGAKRFYSPRPDMIMVGQLQTQLEAAQGFSLHILSPYGSHFGYRDGYPKEDAAFTPDDYNYPLSTSEIPTIINSYDNTVLYTDKVISAAIDLLRKKNAVLLYVSDHGESLGEEGRFFHGQNTAAEQRQVPFFLWFSERFRAANPAIIAALQAHTKEQVHNRKIFHTILGIAGSTTPLRDPARHLTQIQP